MKEQSKEKCSCGFEFSAPGEFRNCEMYRDESSGRWFKICPKCGKAYTVKE